MLYWKREISATPIQLHLKELYGECYPHTLAPNPEMKAVSYTGKTLGRCSIISFRKVVVACSVWVAHVMTRRKYFEFNWPEVRLKEIYIACAECHIINYLLT